MHSKLNLIVLTVLVCLIGGTVLYLRTNEWPSGRPVTTLGMSHLVRVPAPIAHIVIILEENKPKTDLIKDTGDSYLQRLMHTYAIANNYYAITNPSLPNYIALTSGTTAGITDDCSPPSNSCQANVPNLADEIEQSGRTWKEYAESMPSACYKANSGEYAVRHNPFMYYPDITTDMAQCTAHVVPFTELVHDLASSVSLPNYSFITPNLCNDMHDCSVQTGDAWLAQEVPAILASPAFTQQHSLLIVTWDEGDDTDNNTLAIFAGPAAKHTYTSNIPYNHYSLLRTIETAWGLRALTKNDQNAPSMNDMLQ